LIHVALVFDRSLIYVLYCLWKVGVGTIIYIFFSSFNHRNHILSQSREIVCNMRSRLEDGTELDFKKWPSSRGSAHTILLG
jgi:hypothetical protein